MWPLTRHCQYKQFIISIILHLLIANLLSEYQTSFCICWLIWLFWSAPFHSNQMKILSVIGFELLRFFHFLLLSVTHSFCMKWLKPLLWTCDVAREIDRIVMSHVWHLPSNQTKCEKKVVWRGWECGLGEGVFMFIQMGYRGKGNKSEYTATQVACGWAGGQEQ